MYAAYTHDINTQSTTVVEQQQRKQKKTKRSKTATETVTPETAAAETAIASSNGTKEKKSKKRNCNDDELLSQRLNQRLNPGTEGEPAIASVSHPLSTGNSSAATEGMK